MIYQVGKKQCLNSSRKWIDINPQENDLIVQPRFPLEFPGPLTPPPHPPGISNSLRGGGLDIFWNQTFFKLVGHLTVDFKKRKLKSKDS